MRIPEMTFKVKITVTDIERQTRGAPFISEFTLIADPEQEAEAEDRSFQPDSQAEMETSIGNLTRAGLDIPELRVEGV